MFTIEQKKLIVELQTSKKHQGMLIGPDDSETCINRCCLGVYAHACNIKKMSDFIDFESSVAVYTFKDYEKHFLTNDFGLFKNLNVIIKIKINNKEDFNLIDSLMKINETKKYNFSHNFISKFLFTMPERVFTNFPLLPQLSLNHHDFVKEVEEQAKAKDYDKITEFWKQSLK